MLSSLTLFYGIASQDENQEKLWKIGQDLLNLSNDDASGDSLTSLEEVLKKTVGIYRQIKPFLLLKLR